METRRTRTDAEHAALLAHLTAVAVKSYAAEVSDLSYLTAAMAQHEAAIAEIVSPARTGTTRNG